MSEYYSYFCHSPKFVDCLHKNLGKFKCLFKSGNNLYTARYANSRGRMNNLKLAEFMCQIRMIQDQWIIRIQSGPREGLRITVCS